MAPAAPGFKIELREGFLQAWLRIIEPAGIALSEIMHAARTLGISHGLDQALLHEVALSGFQPGEYLIARGTYPERGEDAQVELLVELVPKPRRVEIADESIRYFPVHINSVTRGRKLLTYRPAGLGTPGVTVLGTEVAGIPGRTRANPRGPNTEYSAADPGCLVAAVGGNLVWDGQFARVDPAYTVGGNLSLLNGDKLEFAGDLLVAGDIKVGMTLAIGGNLTVRGTVEDAVIDCAGDVVIHGGAFGNGRGRATAGGSIEVNLAHDYTFRCAGEMVVKREAINCAIDALSLNAPQADIYGGTIVTQRLVEVRNLGRREYSKTSVVIGDRRQIQAALAEVRGQIETCQSKTTECGNWVIKLTRARDSGTGQRRDLEERLQAKRTELRSLQMRIGALTKEAGRLQDDLARLVPKLIVHGAVRHNIHLEMNEAKLLIDDPLTGVVLYEEDGRILKSAAAAR